MNYITFFKAIAIISILILSHFSARSQSWYKQEVSKEISVQFPGTPQKTKVDHKTQSYDFLSPCCLYRVAIITKAIEPYEQYTSLPESHKLKFVNDFLNSVVIGMIKKGKQHFISANDRYVGGLLIKEIVYSDRKPSIKGKQMRYSALILISNTLYTFDCWYLDDEDHEVERQKFFKSILLQE